MQLAKLKLINYRNIRFQEMDLDPVRNFFIGENAQGKTNLLESVYLLAKGRSFKTVPERDLIKVGERSAYVRAEFEGQGRSKEMELKLSMVDGKRIRINRVEIESRRELTHLFDVVLFSPEDLFLIKGGPEGRRGWMDELLRGTDSGYDRRLRDYKKILYQRNQLLKSPGDQWLDRELDALDRLLAEGAYAVEKKRQSLFIDIKEDLLQIQEDLSAGKDRLTLSYQSNVGTALDGEEGKEERGEVWIQAMEERLLQHRKEDRDRGFTSIGPHRDDLLFFLNGMEAKKFASQGQTRTLALAMRFSELRRIERKTGMKPLLLLDDVFSELDSKRAAYLIEGIQDYQTLITSNEMPQFFPFSSGKIFRVKGGEVGLLLDPPS